MSVVFPQPMGELIRACSCSFLVKQEPFHCINIKSRDSSSIRYWKLFRCSILRTGVDFFKIVSGSMMDEIIWLFDFLPVNLLTVSHQPLEPFLCLKKMKAHCQMQHLFWYSFSSSFEFQAYCH